MPGGFFNSYNPHRAFLHHGPDPSKVKEPFPQPSSLPLCWHTLSLPMKLLCCWSQVPVINGLFFLAGRRQHSSSTLHDQRLIESMDTPHVYLRNGRRYSWLLIFAQVTLGCIFLRCRELLCRNSSNDQVSSALENFLEVVSLLRGLGVGGLFWFFGFFFPELPGLSDRTISHRFPFGPPILCFCCSLVWVRGCSSACVCWAECVGVRPHFWFSFFFLCENLFLQVFKGWPLFAVRILQWIIYRLNEMLFKKKNQTVVSHKVYFEFWRDECF